jgi:hypothetical protein
MNTTASSTLAQGLFDLMIQNGQLIHDGSFIDREHLTGFRFQAIADAYGREAEALVHAEEDDETIHGGNTDTRNKIVLAELHSFAFRCADAVMRGDAEQAESLRTLGTQRHSFVETVWPGKDVIGNA